MGPDGRFVWKNVTVRLLMRSAFHVSDSRTEGSPSWFDSDRYDVDAKADGAPTNEQMWGMVRKLLADTFQLTVRTETRRPPTYVLQNAAAAGTLGPQLRTSACVGKESAPPGPRDPNNPPPVPCGGAQTLPGGHLVARWVTIEELATGMLGASRPTRRHGSNRPGRHFDLTVDWVPEPRPGGASGPRLTPAYGRPAPFIGPAFFSALQDQAGLSLIEQAGPVDILVIDHAEQP
jgi:uncharacterized protein (TIGR03435 family)